LCHGGNFQKGHQVRFTTILGAAALTLAAAPALAQTAATTPPGADANATAGATQGASALAVGQPVKDKTGAVIGEITDLKAGTATVKMGDQSFSIAAQSFVVQNGAAVINATQDQLKAMISNAAKGGG
jgi:hypothetical protein